MAIQIKKQLIGQFVKQFSKLLFTCIDGKKEPCRGDSNQLREKISIPYILHDLSDESQKKDYIENDSKWILISLAGKSDFYYQLV